MPPHRQPAQEPTAMDVICQFNKLNPPKFQGGADPLKYEEWVRSCLLYTSDAADE